MIDTNSDYWWKNAVLSTATAYHRTIELFKTQYAPQFSIQTRRKKSIFLFLFQIIGQYLGGNFSLPNLAKDWVHFFSDRHQNGYANSVSIIVYHQRIHNRKMFRGLHQRRTMHEIVRRPKNNASNQPVVCVANQRHKIFSSRWSSDYVHCAVWVPLAVWSMYIDNFALPVHGKITYFFRFHNYRH